MVRILWLVLALGTGVGFIGYLIAWIVMPKDAPLTAAQRCQPVAQQG